ncbi:MAG: DUF1104 domain-containing protein [Campylobacteraceae bacterium]|jgi:hypothetical protein|nr:DUF1104 domain-containing protein [archaeon]MBT3882745.1 DUF1104 domain-containing protein [Campylobacteraceae bacterium]MBT4030068.1 DUF1104 domain-containing protein [Campylobacteraceae bacterium]MBT4179839.1 DUF1104 domain-containing protein [Campylobacteraceae bacterium]MBT4571803.1 DUF1104 domain-containing protein [Campylobacteraceae bacterium]
MKKRILISTVLLAVELCATDYSTFTNDELFNSRGTVTAENREAFKDEMQSRMQSLTPEERSSYRGSESRSGGSANGTMSRLRDGSGSGSSRGRR